MMQDQQPVSPWNSISLNCVERILNRNRINPLKTLSPDWADHAYLPPTNDKHSQPTFPSSLEFPHPGNRHWRWNEPASASPRCPYEAATNGRWRFGQRDSQPSRTKRQENILKILNKFSNINEAMTGSDCCRNERHKRPQDFSWSKFQPSDTNTLDNNQCGFIEMLCTRWNEADTKRLLGLTQQTISPHALLIK